MQKYIDTTVDILIKSYSDFNNVTVILPSKRSGIFVKRAFKNKLPPFRFLPKISSIEDFITNVSKIELADNLVLLFEFYKIYISHTPQEKVETFENFSNWASILITDFSEIDSYLIDPKYIFGYLKDINRIENWFKNDHSKTELTEKYLHFFEEIERYYQAFYKHLTQLHIGYQGLQYREANQKITPFIEAHKNQKFIFIGFNALNKVEENIIQLLLQNDMADIYFDTDQFILQEHISAGHFVKRYQKEWPHFKRHSLHQISNDFSQEKTINIIGVPKSISQIKYANEIIQNNLEQQDNTVLVLAHEDLLVATVNALPNNIDSVNITMGLPLKNILYADLFYLLFKLHQNKKKLGQDLKFYYKDILFVLNHPSISHRINQKPVVDAIKKDNFIFLNKHQIYSLSVENKDQLQPFFSDWTDCNEAITHCFEIISALKKDNTNNFDLEYLQRFEQIFQQITDLNAQYGFVNTLDELNSLFNQILQNEQVSFKGEALSGLQIMGMLETRVLDFETVILTSVNEGFLPAGKTNNSFIPFDVKNEIGLPTYQEKDAIFSYHFYRLITRAKQVYLLYNTESGDFGSGEQSRFLTQLEFFKDKLPNITFTKTIVNPIISNKIIDLQNIDKNEIIITKLISEAEKGFSPTSLTNYIYNPIAFYKQKILKIRPLDGIEETIAANTLGTVIHRVLELFYLPFKNMFLHADDVKAMKKKIDATVKHVFDEEYKNGTINKGKNLLIFEISKQYIRRFLNQEIKLLEGDNKLKIIGLEVNLSAFIDIDGLERPVKLKGQADRIDILNGTIRIIDYKTGLVKKNQLKINHWDAIITDHKYSKSFQVLLYAYMYIYMNTISLEKTPLESGIISFKNLKSGFMKVNDGLILPSDISLFEDALKELLTIIFNIHIPFTENENLPY